MAVQAQLAESAVQVAETQEAVAVQVAAKQVRRAVLGYLF